MESIPERAQKEVWKQITQCACWIDDPKLVTMMNDRTKAFVYQLRVIAQRSKREYNDADFKPLVLGLLHHHCDGKPGEFNGKDAYAYRTEINKAQLEWEAEQLERKDRRKSGKGNNKKKTEKGGLKRG